MSKARVEWAGVGVAAVVAAAAAFGRNECRGVGSSPGRGPLVALHLLLHSELI